MPTKYKHIFFDLDHTLWDFEKNSTETLRELYLAYELSAHRKFTEDDFLHTFRKINFKLWNLYNTGQYDRDRLRNDRFLIILTELGVNEALVPSDIGEAYLRICPTKPHVFPHAIDILTYLKEKYTLHIITNGFSDVQAIKLKSANLTGYFKEIITSEVAGCLKPVREIFDYTVRKIKADCKECIMIGDNLKTDILGAKNAGLDQIYFNPLQIEHQQQVTYEIDCLSQLKEIL